MPAQASEARIGAKPLALRDLSTGTTVVEDVETIPVARPLLPTAAEILPWLHRIDAARVYSNWGPLNSLFEQRLSERFGAHAVTVASGTAGLVCSLLAVCEERPHGLCLLPSWTFVATAHAAAAAGLVPCFLDPDEASWAITPEGVEQAVDGLLSRRCAPFRRVSAVLVVAPFGRPIDVGSWDDFSARTGIPVVIDAAAAVDGLKVGRSPVVVSLHATKCLGIGEGGFVATRDGDLARRIKRAANFGFFGSRRAEVPAINGKLSEYHAAVGLAALQAWPERRERFLAVARRLAAPLRRAGCIMLDGWGETWVSSTCVVRLPNGLSAADAMVGLGLRGIATRSWWGRGCHAHPAFADCPRWPEDSSLEITERLADTTLGLPFFVDLPDGAEDRIADALVAAAGRRRSHPTARRRAAVPAS